MKKLLSNGKSAVAIALSACIVSASIFVTAAQSAGDSGRTLEWSDPPLFSLDFETPYRDANGEAYYNSGRAENWSASNGRGSKAEMASENGNTYVRLTYDTENGNENYNANAVMNLYDLGTKSKFAGTPGKLYTVSFDYKVEETDGQELQLFIVPSCREAGYPNANPAFSGTDMGPKAVMGSGEYPFTNPATGVLTEKTNGWVRASVTYTGQSAHNGHTVYPIILLQTNGKNKVENHTGAYASVLIDNVEVALPGSFTLDFETPYRDANGEAYYNSGRAENWSASNGRGSKAEMASENGNTYVRLTYDTENGNENYNANAVMNLYDLGTKSKFAGTPGKLYTVSFDYKVEETDGQELQLFIVPSCREAGYPNANPAFSGTDMGPKAVMGSGEYPFTNPATGVLTEKTNGWVRASVTYTGQSAHNGHTVYPIILLQTNGKNKVENHTGAYASVLIDNVSVKVPQQARITCYNNDGSDKSITIYEYTTFGDLEIPSRQGYYFDGWYTDAAYTKQADANELVGNYNAIYAKWSGDGTAMTPQNIADYTDIKDVKEFHYCYTNQDIVVHNSESKDLEYRRNSNIEAISADKLGNFYGAYTFSYDEIQKEITAYITPEMSFQSGEAFAFYVELSDFERSGDKWGLGIKASNNDRGITLAGDWVGLDFTKTNKVYYAANNTWVESEIDENGHFVGIPSGYRGYILIDPSKLSFKNDLSLGNNTWIFQELNLQLNAVGAENGSAVLGGVIYQLSKVPTSTVARIENYYYNLSLYNDASVVNPYAAFSEESSGLSTRYTGTNSVVTAKFTETETSALWGTMPAGITSKSGKAESTTGFMNTYTYENAGILLQPGVDSFMLYVEMPEFKEGTVYPALKMLDTVISQGSVKQTLSFSNSVYQYASVYDGVWNTARAGADGDLYGIPSGFKGYLKFNMKQFKNSKAITGINFSKPYAVASYELGFNHFGGENGNFVIGGVYSLMTDSALPFLQNGMTGETLCLQAIPGDFDCDGTYNAEDLVQIRKTLLGVKCGRSAAARLREENITLLTLIRAKKVLAGTAKAELSVPTGHAAAGKDIFTADYTSSNTPTTYSPALVTDYAAKIEADTSLNSEAKAISFVQEINGNKVGDFEKIGIDKMCHVSTFTYAKGNIYVSYYANTISAAEDPQYQVARLAYAPENNTDNKVILDIMQVGDDLYGYKVTGVYDTILMQKEDEPDNLYILWTASINGKYYRLYRIFNMETEEMGEIGVNRFKVGNVTNDFSSTGIQKALTANDIGYKWFFADIGIMQKLSTRVENGETYYYTGAYSGNFTCIIKSKDLITWEYVAQPDEGANGTGFANATKWENAVYVLGDKVYYFVRQWDPDTSSDVGSYYGILTSYDLNTKEWAKPVLVGDCQSRSDFIYYKGNLYLFYAPTDREHIGILRIDTGNLANSKVVLQADMGGSCFYPFVQYNSRGELCMSYTVDRKHIRLASFTLSNYID